MSSAFLEAYRRCMAEEKGQTPRHFMPMPAVVCAAFSAEVGLKVILHHEGKEARGHNLLDLYRKVSPERRYKIYELVGMEMEKFVAHLGHSRLAFLKWRYIYEEDAENHISVDFMGRLATAVEIVALEAKNAA